MTDEARNTIWAVAVLVAALAFGLSSFIIPDFGGFEPDQFPVQQNEPPVQPAGYAFSIWAVIYLWLVAGAAFGVVARAQALDWADMRPYLTLSLLVGASWLAVAKMSPLAATLLIWVMLVAGLKALFQAPLLDRWWGRAPLGLYTGWLSAASSVALGLVLAGYGIMGEVEAAILSLILAVALAAVIQILIEGVPEYGIAVVWALVAVAIGNLDGGPFFVVVLSLAGAVLIGLLAIRAMTIPRA